ncbi:MAG: polysaccharide synthesis protein GtrA [Anaerocolumna sp.]|nr:polysaccharide synthesis protein GtrA [Anaerocolumna sp.]
MPEKHNLRKEFIRSIKFLMFSISAGVVQIISFSLLHEFTDLEYWISYVIALIISVIWNFTLNRRYTFQSANNVTIAMLKILGFYCVFTPLSTLLGDYLADTLEWNEYIVTLINMILNFSSEFIYDRLFVFQNSIDTNNIAKRALPKREN